MTLIIFQYNAYLDHYFGISNLNYKLDSLTWVNDNKGIDSLISIDVFVKKNYKKFNEPKKRDYLARMKSAQLTMAYIDSINVLGLIRITEKYGFPSHERLVEQLGTNEDKTLTSSPQLIFVHTPKVLFPKVRKLVIKEYLSGRLDKNACSRIFWHLNGRIGDPFSENYEHCKVDTLR